MTPVDPSRHSLYTAAELYDRVIAGGPYADSMDARAYAWSQQPYAEDAALAKVLHDHAIDEALEDWVRGRRLVGVMGGHAAERGTRIYRDAALLGHGLGTATVVATGGGPGAMEAANLGGRMAGQDPALLDEALARLAAVPSFHPDIEAWVGAALDVATPTPHDSLGIPTWHYGHEPPNVFATAIAKYFRNAQREAILLQICDGGIVFLPGAAGTIQEVFQDACENFYVDEAHVTPMILVGHTFWTQTLPVWPLLTALARGRAMESYVHLVDSPSEAIALLADGRDVTP